MVIMLYSLLNLLFVRMCVLYCGIFSCALLFTVLVAKLLCDFLFGLFVLLLMSQS